MPANLGSTNKVKRIILINIVSESKNANTQPRVKQGKACLPTRVAEVVGRKGKGSGDDRVEMTVASLFNARMINN